MDKTQAGGERRLKSELLAYKRTRIIEEASHLFYERGYSGSTLDALAERLFVTKPFLYSYFKNKEAILAEICETGIREALEVLDEALDHPGSHRETLIEVIRKVGKIVIERQEYVVVYQREMKHLSEADYGRIIGMRQEFDHKVAEFVAEGAAAGEFHADPDPLVAVWIGGLISWIPTWYSRGGRRSAEEVIDHLVVAALRLVGAEE